MAAHGPEPKLIRAIEKEHGFVMTACCDDGSAFFVHKEFGGVPFLLTETKIKKLAAIRKPRVETPTL